MPRYRKRPHVVEAEQWWLGKQIEGLTEGVYMFGTTKYFGALLTEEGYQGVHEGDYVVTGVKGERYVCPKDVFDMSYEPVIED